MKPGFFNRLITGPHTYPHKVVLNANGPREGTTGNGFYPPDTTGAIGPSQIVYPVNQSLNVYDRTGALQRTVTLNAFFGTSDALSDPRVVYDEVWNRWVITDIRIPQSGDTVAACVWTAFSLTSDANGAYYVYRPCMSGGVFAAGDLWHYDITGVSQDAVLITGNIFSPSAYKGAAVLPIPKAKVYNGLGWSAPVPVLPTSVGTVTPPHVYDSNANAFFIARDSNGTQLDLYRGNNLSNESQFTFTLQATISASSAIPPSATQPGVSGTANTLDTLDGRFEQVTSQVGSSLWAVHTIALGGFPAPKFYQINTSTNAITQSGYFFETATSDDFNASIAANGAGEAFVTWSATDTGSAPHNARIRTGGRQPGDTLNVMSVGVSLATSPVALTGNFDPNFGLQRWGDYSSVALDPTNVSGCGQFHQAAVFNEKILTASLWGSNFGIMSFCP